MRKLRVLFVIGTLDVGGSEKQLVELASRIDRQVFEPVVCCLGIAGDLVAPLRDRGVRVHVLGLKRTGKGLARVFSLCAAVSATVWRLWRVLRREKPDIVHGILLLAYLLSTFLGRLAGVPVIVSSRRSLGLFKARKYHYRLLERVARPLTDLFVANSEAVRQDTIAREGVRESDIIVIRNGLDTSRFGGRRDPRLEQALDLSNRFPRVIVVSNFIYYKGHSHFLRAWREVTRKFPAAVAILVGDGPLRSDLEELVDAQGLRDSVRFTGTRHDVPALLALSDLYVHPSMEEGYSNALLEAMASGLPVVATGVGGNVEAVTDRVTGLLVPAGDPDALAAAIVRVLSDSGLAHSMGARARTEAVAKYDVNIMVRAYEDLYSRLAARVHGADAAAGETTPAESR